MCKFSMFGGLRLLIFLVIRASGYHEYGPLYAERVLETFRRPVEQCEALQTFLVMHSLGGGTGSGFGRCVFSLSLSHTH
jgi:hypothetical protein